MKREIKFRAWDKNKKVFIPTDLWAIVSTDFNAFGIMLKDWEDYKEGEYFYETSQELSQFTGLTDKNGKEIYEGDLLRWSIWILGSNFERLSSKKINAVEWSSKKGKFFIGSELWDLGAYSDIEIIGNIYENPNLLSND